MKALSLALVLALSASACSVFNTSARYQKRATKAGLGQQYRQCLTHCESFILVCDTEVYLCKQQRNACVRLCRQNVDEARLDGYSNDPEVLP